jgi:uncharacterized protein
MNDFRLPVIPVSLSRWRERAGVRALAFALCTLVTAAWAQAPSTTAPVHPGSLQGRADGSTFRTIKWDALVPPNWNPMAEFKDLNFAILDDGDPRAVALLKRLREVWDAAPVHAAMVGQAVRIPGYVVPLEDSKDGMKEFLLVPYFGACIHSPPPPANQIIHVLPRQPAKGLRSMDAVWISGVLAQDRVDTHMGVSGWTMAAQRVEPYVEPKR